MGRELSKGRIFWRSKECRLPKIFYFIMKASDEVESPELTERVDADSLRPPKTDKKSDKNTLVVVSYNLLAQQYINNNHSNYPASPKSSLKWTSRKHGFKTLLQSLKADVLAFQEMDHLLYEQFFNPFLN